MPRPWHWPKHVHEWTRRRDEDLERSIAELENTMRDITEALLRLEADRDILETALEELIGDAPERRTTE